MTYRHNQSGFSVLEIVIVIVVVVIIGFLGYTFYNNYQNKAAEETSMIVEDVPTAPTISSASDLDKANTAMDEAEIESATSEDLSELEKDLSNF